MFIMVVRLTKGDIYVQDSDIRTVAFYCSFQRNLADDRQCCGRRRGRVIPIRIGVYPLRVRQNDLDQDAFSEA